MVCFHSHETTNGKICKKKKKKESSERNKEEKDGESMRSTSDHYVDISLEAGCIT